MSFLKRSKNKDKDMNPPSSSGGVVEGGDSKSNPDQGFVAARRSNRISRQQFSRSDGDTWQETFAVCEQANTTKNKKKTNDGGGGDGSDASNNLVIRSYYTNQRTSERVWDEPPSGAARIIQASDEMRRMAEIQLLDMQIVTNSFDDGADGASQEKNTTTKQRKGFFRRNNTNSKHSSSSNIESDDAAGGSNDVSSSTTPTEEQQKHNKPRIVYKKNGIFANHAKGQHKLKKKSGGDSLDPDLQKAIALSMGAQFETTASSNGQEYEDEDIAMAKALSMSEQPQSRQHSTNASDMASTSVSSTSLSEVEALRIALEESRKSTKGTVAGAVAAAEPQQQEADLLGFGSAPLPPSSSPLQSQQHSSDSLMDQKMPAKQESNIINSSVPPTPPSTPYNPRDKDIITSLPPATESGGSGSGNVKTWPPPMLGDEASASLPKQDDDQEYEGLQKMITPHPAEETKKPTAKNKFARRLQKKKDVQDQAGLV